MIENECNFWSGVNIQVHAYKPRSVTLLSKVKEYISPKQEYPSIYEMNDDMVNGFLYNQRGLLTYSAEENNKLVRQLLCRSGTAAGLTVLSMLMSKKGKLNSQTTV